MKAEKGKSPIRESEQLKKYYQEKKIVDQYIRKRFSEPLNVIEHRQQVHFLNKIIKERNCKTIVEFAPGPGRVTTEVIAENGLSIDSSKNMLILARERMAKKGKKWTFRQGDILNDSFRLSSPADIVFCFRFLLHFQAPERSKIYAQASKILKKDGYLAFEAMNKKIVQPVRNLLGNKRYFIYDKLYTKKELWQELEQNGFKLIKLYPVLTHFKTQSLLSRPFKILGMQKSSEAIISLLERITTSQPYQWIVLCQKK